MHMHLMVFEHTHPHTDKTSAPIWSFSVRGHSESWTGGGGNQTTDSQISK